MYPRLKMKKIKIDDDNYIIFFATKNFELHCRATGPLGANVYFFENNAGGYLKWSQRRSYGGRSPKKKY